MLISPVEICSLEQCPSRHLQPLLGQPQLLGPWGLQHLLRHLQRHRLGPRRLQGLAQRHLQILVRVHLQAMVLLLGQRLLQLQAQVLAPRLEREVRQHLHLDQRLVHRRLRRRPRLAHHQVHRQGLRLAQLQVRRQLLGLRQQQAPPRPQRRRRR